jgi:hypothetical protein
VPHRPLRLLLVLATAVPPPPPCRPSRLPTAAPAGTVGTDPAGDWGSAVAAQSAPVGDALAQDLRSARLVPSAEGKALTFVLGVTALPASAACRRPPATPGTST